MKGKKHMLMNYTEIYLNNNKPYKGLKQNLKCPYMYGSKNKMVQQIKDYETNTI
jgi:hypothetical protein